MKNKPMNLLKDANKVKIDNPMALTGSDPFVVLDKAKKELAEAKGETSLTPDSLLFKYATLFEFENGMLMATSVSEQYRTFAIDLNRKFQQEFDCKTSSEKATAELAVISYIRTVEIQRKINNYLELGSNTGLGVQFLTALSKELDRANRHFLTAVQTLRMTRQPPMNVNIKTQTAVIGQNQIVQSNSQ